MFIKRQATFVPFFYTAVVVGGRRCSTFFSRRAGVFIKRQATFVPGFSRRPCYPCCCHCRCCCSRCPFLVNFGRFFPALLRGIDVDAEGFAHTQDLLRRKPSVGSDVRQFSKNIAGRAMVCTSVLSVVPREIAFGNCNIGKCVSSFVCPCALFGGVFCCCYLCTGGLLKGWERGGAYGRPHAFVFGGG